MSTKTPDREDGQTDVLQLTADPIPVVRVGFIGLGMRGIGAVERFTYLDSVEVRGLCDIMQQNVDSCQNILKRHNKPAAELAFADSTSWKKLCEDPNIDLIYICTDWKNHTPMAVYAMEHGKHVAIEVPAATTIDECWQLVNTSEKTRKHCMMLENCCYDFFELATLNMAQQGLFGEVIHGEGAYIHNLTDYNFGEEFKGGYHNNWRRSFNEEHTGNPYPTHGLGPICQIMNIHRGDKMNYLVSMSTDQFGMTKAAIEKKGKDSHEAGEDYNMGDMNTTLIRTEKGHTIMIQHDVTSPRPYNRIHLVSGTKGFAQKYPVQQIALEPDFHKALPEKEMQEMLKKYEHPFVKEIGEKAKKVGGHGGMDFIMDYRLIHCLRHGLPLDQDVYDAAEWSCLVELTEKSVKNNSAPVEIPDFTRGAWDKLKKLQFAK
nr:Gfo/Idh/MocA family oxidoreductase [Porphyromonas pogonae]